MFSTCSELTQRAPIPDGRMEQIMQPCSIYYSICKVCTVEVQIPKVNEISRHMLSPLSASCSVSTLLRTQVLRALAWWVGG